MICFLLEMKIFLCMHISLYAYFYLFKSSIDDITKGGTSSTS